MRTHATSRARQSLCPSSRGDPDDSETPPNINFLLSFGQENSQKQSGTKTVFLNWIRHQFLEIFHFLWIAATWLKINQFQQVGGVLESSGPPLIDGHRDFQNWCTLGSEIDENECAILNDPNCKFVHHVMSCYWSSHFVTYLWLVQTIKAIQI